MESDPPLSNARPIIPLLLAALASVLSISADSEPHAASDPSGVPSIREAMELNRAGRWDEAAQLARRFLDTAESAPLAERCEAFYHYAYACSLLGRKESADEAVAGFDRECAGLTDGNWLRREIELVRTGHYGTATRYAARAGTERLREEDGFWQSVDPERVKLNAAALAAHRDLCERSGADACLVVRQGKIVQEWYSPRYEYPMYAMSSTKSITGLLVGMLMDEGKLESTDEPVCTFVEEWCTGDKGKVTVEHLLSQTSGLRRMDNNGVGSATNKNPFVIGLPLTHAPGTRWAYSNEGVQLLSPVLDRIAGEPIQNYAKRKLFEPLGMTNTRLRLDSAGRAWTYAAMLTTPRDMARIGVLMLDRGTWKDRRIVGEQWVRRSTAPSQSFNKRYGLLWWLYDDPAGFAAIGYLDTSLYVFPRLDLVVVRMQSKPSEQTSSRYEPAALPLFKRMVRPG